MKEMFKGKVNSPQTQLLESIDSHSTDIKVLDVSVFPEGPNLAVIGTDAQAETIKYTNINNNILVGCVRGFQGTAKSWEKDSIIARNFTEYDLNAIQENISEISKKQLKDFKDDETHRTVTDAEKEKWNDKISQSQITGDINASGSDKVYHVDFIQKQFDLLDTNKADKNKIPTKISQLENDTTFKTEAEIQSMIEKASSLKKEVVTSLPTTGKDDVIYLVKDPKGKDNNNYLEYLWLNDKYELIGSTQVDLSGYAKKDEVKNIQEQLGTYSNLYLKKEDKVIVNNDTNWKVDEGYTTPYFVDVAIINHMGPLDGYLQENFNKKLNTSDIQEFTQQELEEAFK